MFIVIGPFASPLLSRLRITISLRCHRSPWTRFLIKTAPFHMLRLKSLLTRRLRHTLPKQKTRTKKSRNGGTRENVNNKNVWWRRTKSPTEKCYPKNSTEHAIKIQHVLSLFPDDKSFEKFAKVLVSERKTLNHCKEGAYGTILSGMLRPRKKLRFGEAE